MTHQSGGVLYLRVEDTDAKREVPGAVETLIEALSHYHIEFDEGATVEGDRGQYGPYRQRQRRDIYHVFAKKLVQEGKAYPVSAPRRSLQRCTRRRRRRRPTSVTSAVGRVARPSFEDVEAALDAGTPWVLRFRSEGSAERKIKFTDLVKGQP